VHCFGFITKNHLKLSLIITLLVIGGVERNPGPVRLIISLSTDSKLVTLIKVILSQISVVETSNAVLQDVLEKLNGSDNFTYAKFIWGQASKIILSDNSVKSRQFLQNLSQILPTTERVIILIICDENSVTFKD